MAVGEVARALRALNRHVEWAATPPSDLTPLPVDGAKAATIILTDVDTAL